MVKRLLSIVLLAVTVLAHAQEPALAPQQMEDYCWGKLPGYPEHYCTCRNTSTSFSYPLQVAVTDTMWFSASVNDLKQGLSAYWFADCSVTFEVYAFCSSKTPTFVMTTGANQMCEMDMTEINARLEEMGEVAELMAQTLTPRIKVYPNGGTGSVYCYPYDQGPVSICSEPLPIIPRMTYVCDQADEVYELKPEHIATNGKGFIRWKQKKNLAGTIRLTDGACNGPEIVQMTLTDSTRVMMLNPADMLAAKQAGRSVFIHVTHPADYVGRIYYHKRIVWDVQTIDTTICQGKGLELADTVLYETTTYSNDTLWTGQDTLSLTNYNLQIEVPEAQYDTLRLKANQLPYNYRNQMVPENGWGDYDWTIHNGVSCDDHVLVHVVHDTVRTSVVIRDTTCMGKTIKYGDVTYTTDTVLLDSIWVDADTWAVRDIAIHFTEPELEYDTISVKPSEFTANGYWYAELGMLVKQYGDTLLVKTKKNTCTRWIYLTVLQAEEEIPEEPETPTNVREAVYEEKPYKYMRDGMLYFRREGKEYDLLGRPTGR